MMIWEFLHVKVRVVVMVVTKGWVVRRAPVSLLVSLSKVRLQFNNPRLGMLPHILTVLSRDYRIPPQYDPYSELLVYGGTSLNPTPRNTDGQKPWIFRVSFRAHRGLK